MSSIQSEEDLFVVQKKHLNTGMRGFPIGFCPTSSADPNTGLHYAGIPVQDVIDWDPLEVIYLLYYGKKGGENEIFQFRQEIEDQDFCSQEVIDVIYRLSGPKISMKQLSVALLLWGMYDGKRDYRQDFLSLLKNLPLLCAHIINSCMQWGHSHSFPSPFSYVDNFIDMIYPPQMDQKNQKRWKEILRLFTILHLDHGGGNLSTFIGKGVASGLEDLSGSLSAAMSALEGARHGKANQKSLQLVQEIYDHLGEDFSEEELKTLLRRKIENRELIYGFGHAVLCVEDPRASLLYQWIEKHASEHPLVRVALRMRTIVPEVLKENPRIRHPYPNVDAVSGVAFMAAGFPYPFCYPLLFGFSRLIGISIQIIYERCEACNGKGTPIIRPRYFFQKRSSDLHDPSLENA